MRRAWIVLVVAVALAAALAGPAAATKDITVSVTLVELGVDVSPEAWNIGLIGPTVIAGPAAFTATNVSEVEEAIVIWCDASSPSGWQPVQSWGGVPPLNYYAMGAALEGQETPTFVYANPVYLTTTAVAPGASIGFSLWFRAPGYGTPPSSETIVVTLAGAAPPSPPGGPGDW